MRCVNIHELPFKAKVALDAHIGSGGAAHADATVSVDGFMSAADKTKLDGIASSANNYTHPANHPASIITQDASNRFVTDAEKTTWNAKQAAGNYATPDSPIRLNPREITANFTVGSDYNATSTGPITIQDGVTVTVANNATYTIQ